MTAVLISDMVIIGRWSKKRFRVIRPIGSGGFGTVYLVEDVDCGTKKALKMSRNTLALVREFTILQKLNKDNNLGIVVLPVDMLDDALVGNTLYTFIIMDYLEGENLKQLVRKRRFSIKETLAFGYLMGTLLGLMHRYGYVYCDVKPENVMFDQAHGQFRLVDFGGVREMGRSVVQYTPAYDRASYHCGLRSADPGYDLFALTCLMITMHMGNEPRPPNAHVAGLPKELKSIWRGVCTGRIRQVTDFLPLCQTMHRGSHKNLLVYGVGLTSLVCFLVTVVCLL
jgi:serine/threonine-protein kinase